MGETIKKEVNIKDILDLFLTFFKIGLVAFGGGYSMIPLIEKEMVDKRKWIEEEEVLDIFALSESIPGSLSINNSILIGKRVGSILGAIAAMIGTILPSFIIIIIVAMAANTVGNNPVMQAAFVGIRTAVAGLILITGINMARKTIKNKLEIGLFVITIIGVIFMKLNASILILIGGVLGILYNR
ncbi:chromate transporter [Tissierella sp. MSJ-40]|uniref:Chromate transporter n=1 Tax=Tissierella simiarum TaxID=2841534 RepID=A0ABS6EAW8_9FIRM|nr:chromate transporter [Tissierella simiarum]MBU5439909.1 chromate transporter [Tissierella simiarum]